jgi:hypothetical protein
MAAVRCIAPPITQSTLQAVHANPHQQAGNQPRPYAQAVAYQPNGAPPNPQPMPGAVPLLPNQGRVIQQGPVRVLCIADVRGSFCEMMIEASLCYWASETDR